MREHKGFGREWARRWRVRDEEKQAAEKVKRVAPVYVAASLKKPSEKRPAKVVITCTEVKQLINDLGYKRTTGRVRRRFAEMLRFDRRYSWT
jgi:hypothetical protein